MNFLLLKIKISVRVRYQICLFSFEGFLQKHPLFGLPVYLCRGQTPRVVLLTFTVHQDVEVNSMGPRE